MLLCLKLFPGLWSASESNQIEAIRVLVEFNANVHQAEPAGQLTPLHIAAMTGSVDALKVLLELKADATTKAKDVSYLLHRHQLFSILSTGEDRSRLCAMAPSVGVCQVSGISPF